MKVTATDPDGLLALFDAYKGWTIRLGIGASEPVVVQLLGRLASEAAILVRAFNADDGAEPTGETITVAFEDITTFHVE